MSTDLNLAATIYAMPGTTSGASCSSFGGTPSNPSNVNDGDDGSYSVVGAATKNGPCTYSIHWVSDLGAAYDVASARVLVESAGPLGRDVEYSAVGTAGPWTVVASTGATDGGSGEWWEPTFSTTNARYWRLSWHDVRPGLSYYASKQLKSWELLGEEATAVVPVPGIW